LPETTFRAQGRSGGLIQRPCAQWLSIARRCASTDRATARQVVATFKQRNDASLCCAVARSADELFGCPCVILFAPLQLRKRIVAVRIEPRRHEDQFGVKGTQGRKAFIKPALPEDTPVGTTRQWQVAAICTQRYFAAVGIERRLKTVEHEHRRIACKDLLGAVSMVNIPVDHRNPFQAQLGNGIPRGNGHVIEDAKAHGPP